MKNILSFLVLLMGTSFAIQAQTTCSAAFTFTTNPSGAVTFVASNAMLNSPTTMYSWSFGNGTAGYGNTTTCNYNSMGTYTVCLMTQDTMGTCTDTVCQTVTLNSAGTCSAAFTANFGSGGVCYFNATDAATNPSSTTYTWSFDGGTTWSNLGANPSYTFSASGTVDVLLAISNQGGSCIDSSTQTITVPVLSNCNASFYIYPDSNGAPSTYIGVNTSTGTGLSYIWTWGDGSTSTGQYPSHTYAAAGNYTICLTISGGNCVDSFCYNATINKAAAMYSVTFSASPASVSNLASVNISLIPNPTFNGVVLKADAKKYYQVEITNLQGQRVFSSRVTGGQFISMDNLASATYAVKVIDENGNKIVQKIIKR